MRSWAEMAIRAWVVVAVSIALGLLWVGRSGSRAGVEVATTTTTTLGTSAEPSGPVGSGVPGYPTRCRSVLSEHVVEWPCMDMGLLLTTTTVPTGKR